MDNSVGVAVQLVEQSTNDPNFMGSFPAPLTNDPNFMGSYPAPLTSFITWTRKISTDGRAIDLLSRV